MSMVCEGCKRLEGIVDWHRLGEDRGVFGVVVVDGLVRCGDSLTVIGFQQALDEDRVGRIATVLDLLDPSEPEAVLLADLLRWAGVQTAYARAFPSYVPRLREFESLKRVVRSDGRSFIRTDSEPQPPLGAGLGRNQIAAWASLVAGFERPQEKRSIGTAVTPGMSLRKS